MPEFPDIRVDFFSKIHGRRPPLACFLSHVHSDHLAGLDSFKAPLFVFRYRYETQVLICSSVYCSAATKELLLRLERYPHRLNFALGVLESRKQQYKHLKSLLVSVTYFKDPECYSRLFQKPIPLETPTRIELAPGNDIQVTLFDANHCTGAVMFCGFPLLLTTHLTNLAAVIEGNDKAILYTGDIRSEPWFVNSLTRNPFLIEYTAGLKKLDCIYLDTSNTKPVEFPTKADGLKELLQKVSQYPPDTVFHFEAWTFGYEEVWMALSRALNSPVRRSLVSHVLLSSYITNLILDTRRQLQVEALSVSAWRQRG
jgi:DNA cross-link repair 1C protein